MKEKTGLAKVRARSTAIAATVFLLPTILLIIVYMIYPIIDTFVISMYKWNGISSDRVFIGFTNWQNLLADGEFWTSFGHNVIVMVFSILLQIPIGLLLATFLDALGKKANAFKIVWVPVHVCLGHQRRHLLRACLANRRQECHRGPAGT